MDDPVKFVTLVEWLDPKKCKPPMDQDILVWLKSGKMIVSKKPSERPAYSEVILLPDVLAWTPIPSIPDRIKVVMNNGN